MAAPIATAANFDKSYQGQRVPEHIRGGMLRYINEGVPTGGFLAAVFANDLFGAIAKADEINRRNLYAICSWVYSEAPRECWGSAKAYSDWLAAMHCLRCREPAGDGIDPHAFMAAKAVYWAAQAALGNREYPCT